MQRILYTVILGNYDKLPTIRVARADVRWICFTDTPDAFSSTNPWTFVEIEPFFQDRKYAVGYLKSLSHVIFGNDTVSLWVDANLHEIDLSEAFAPVAPVAVAPHLVRSTVSAEIDEVVLQGLEEKFTAERHRAFLRDKGFPDDVGLSATMLLLRDHRDPRVRQANAVWWDVISRGVRRDQLSFNFALWAAGIQPLQFDIDWRAPNRLFTRSSHHAPSALTQTQGAGSLASLPRMRSAG